MNKFGSKFYSKSTDELIIISFNLEENKSNGAIQSATLELEKRGINEQEREKRYTHLLALEKQKEQEELDRRSNEDFSLLDKIVIMIRWPHAVFSDWDLENKGYHLKATNRKLFIFFGIVGYLLVYGFISSQTGNNYHDPKANAIASQFKMDTVGEHSVKIHLRDKSKFNRDVESNNILGIWSADSTEPHADFEIDSNYITFPDFGENRSFQYQLKNNDIVIQFPEGEHRGKTIKAKNDTLIISWENDPETTYLRWKN